MSWVAQEFETLDLGDARLNKRAVLLAERLAAKPTASIPNACSNWTETIAAYRFLSNDRLSWEDVMQPHWQASIQRMAPHPLVLCLFFFYLGGLTHAAWRWLQSAPAAMRSSSLASTTASS